MEGFVLKKKVNFFFTKNELQFFAPFKKNFETMSTDCTFHFSNLT